MIRRRDVAAGRPATSSSSPAALGDYRVSVDSAYHVALARQYGEHGTYFWDDIHYAPAHRPNLQGPAVHLVGRRARARARRHAATTTCCANAIVALLGWLAAVATLVHFARREGGDLAALLGGRGVRRQRVRLGLVLGQPAVGLALRLDALGDRRLPARAHARRGAPHGARLLHAPRRIPHRPARARDRGAAHRPLARAAAHVGLLVVVADRTLLDPLPARPAVVRRAQGRHRLDDRPAGGGVLARRAGRGRAPAQRLPDRVGAGADRLAGPGREPLRPAELARRRGARRRSRSRPGSSGGAPRPRARRSPLLVLLVATVLPFGPPALGAEARVAAGALPAHARLGRAAPRRRRAAARGRRAASWCTATRSTSSAGSPRGATSRASAATGSRCSRDPDPADDDLRRRQGLRPGTAARRRRSCARSPRAAGSRCTAAAHWMSVLSLGAAPAARPGARDPRGRPSLARARGSATHCEHNDYGRRGRPARPPRRARRGGAPRAPSAGRASRASTWLSSSTATRSRASDPARARTCRNGRARRRLDVRAGRRRGDARLPHRRRARAHARGHAPGRGRRRGRRGSRAASSQRRSTRISATCAAACCRRARRRAGACVAASPRRAPAHVEPSASAGSSVGAGCRATRCSPIRSPHSRPSSRP